MLRSRATLFASMLGLSTFVSLSAANAWKLPPIDGEFAGEFTPLKVDGAAAVRWSLTVRTAKPRERMVEFKVDGPDISLLSDAQLDPRGEGTWRLVGARIDLGRWFTTFAAYAGAAFGGISLQGSFEARGEGTWSGGVLGGRATVTWRDGRLDDPARKLSLEGIAIVAEFADLARLRTLPRQVVTWRGGHYDTFAIGEGRAVFELSGDEVRLEQAVITALGGEVTLDAATVSLKRPDVSLTAHVRGVDVTQLLFLLPSVLSEARGRLDGRIALKRDAAGLQIGAGRLSLREGESAELRLAPTPGLLSSNLPVAALQHYPGLAKLELGETPLRAESLEITFTPEGDAEGRTAWVHLSGGPVDPKLRAPIDLNVNVRGPLESLIKFGTNSRLRFGGAR